MRSGNDPIGDLLLIELASVLAGPSVGQFFAELGARVVKVENPLGGDVTRSWRAPGQAAGAISAYFACCNYGKESVALDLRDGRERDLVLRLIDQADIVTMSFRKGPAERLGLGAEELTRRNPRLIVGRITGYGMGDRRAGYDAVIQAESGFMSINGDPDSGPVKMPVALTDVLAAHQLKEGLLLALLRRQMSGRGGVVDVSLIESAVSALANQATNYFATGRVPRRVGSAHPNIAPYGTVYSAMGEELVLAVGNDAQFRALCETLGRSELADDTRFLTNRDRVQHREALEHLLVEAIGTWSRDELLGALNEAGVPAGAVNWLSEVFENGYGNSVTLTDKGRRAGLRQAVFQDPSRVTLLPPPRLGADTRSVLEEFCGASAEEIDWLGDSADQ